MSVQNKAAAKPAATRKAPKKLTPRPAAAPAEVPVTEAVAVAATVAEAPVVAAVEAPAPVVSPAPEAKVKKAAKPTKPEIVEKVEKVEKPRKPKLVRDSYAMPDTEYARIGELKKRLGGLGVEIKKSELLRAGILLLAALNDDELKAVSGRVERIKTGRPSKK